MDLRDTEVTNGKGVRGEEERDFGLTSRFLASVIIYNEERLRVKFCGN